MWIRERREEREKVCVYVICVEEEKKARSLVGGDLSEKGPPSYTSEVLNE